jgi:CBS domain containing-hemolysin-like protein
LFVLAQAEGEPQLLWDFAALIAIPVLVILNGLFVAAEFALVSLRKTRVEEMVGKGVSGARAVLAALHRLDRSIAATQLGITLMSIALGFIGEPALAALVQYWTQVFPPAWRGIVSHSVATLLAFLLITYIHVVFGELIPKAVALQTSDRAALWLSRPLLAFARLTRPLILLMNGTAKLILWLFGLKPASGEEMAHSVEELMLLIEDTEEAGILDADQAEFVQNVFHLSDKHVVDCMVPRDKMMALELSTPPEKVLEAARTGAHTRMPVYEGELDNIVGIVNTKDLFYLFSQERVIILQDALYPALFLRPHDNIANALRLFRKAHRPMAVVRDEEGKVHGLITLEDVLEEIVGELEDEHDRPTPKLPPRQRSRPAAPARSLVPVKQAAEQPLLRDANRPRQEGPAL